MTEMDLPIFGFEYQHAGKACVVHITAPDQKQAVARLASMVKAEYIGRLRQDGETTTS